MLTFSFTLNQEWDGDYTGTASHAFAGTGFSWTATITDACVTSASQVTVRGDIHTTNTSYSHGLVSIRDDSVSYSARAGHWTSEAHGDTSFAQQCDGANSFPASGSSGSLSVYVP